SSSAARRRAPGSHRRQTLPRKSASLVVLVLVGPTFAVPGPIFFVVADQAFDVQAIGHRRREASAGEIFDLFFEAFFLTDQRVDLAEAGLPEHFAEALVEIAERGAEQLALHLVEALGEAGGARSERRRVGAIARGHRLQRQPRGFAHRRWRGAARG